MTKLPHQMLIGLGGSLFTGKTTIGRELQRQLNLAFVPVDFVRILLYNETVKYRDDPDGDTKQLSRAYPAQAAITDALLELGDSLIIEGTFSRQAYHETIRKICEKHHVPFKLILLQVPEDKEEEVIQARSRQRAPDDPSGGTSIADYRRTKDRFEWPTFPHCSIDSTQPLNDCVEQIIAYLLA